MSTNDLQALFANLRPKSRDPSSASAAPASQPATLFNLPSSPPPPFSSTNPAHMPNDPSISMHPGPGAANGATAQSLLSLLNFGSAPTAPQAASTPTSLPAPLSAEIPSNTVTSPPSAISASDLVARFMSPPAAAAVIHPQDHSGGDGNARSDPSQAALLKLLSKTHPSQTGRPTSGEPSQSGAVQPSAPSLQNGTKTTATPGTGHQTSTATETDKPEIQSAKENKPLFSYTNPFEALNASRTQTPKSSTPVPKSLSPIFNLSAISDSVVEAVDYPRRQGSPAQLSLRKKLTPRLPPTKAAQLNREGSFRSSGTPEPIPAPSTPEIKVEASPPKALADIAPEPSVALPQEKPAVAQEKDDNAVDEWEDADDSPVPELEDRKVPVYNFPIKPFVSITLQLQGPSDIGLREDGVMEISRLKKEFDQVDRSLAAATSKYIGYALVKNGGMRIIRQDDGSDRQVFKNSHDRIFNLSFCTTATNTLASDDQGILGTGISGSVYYATVSKDGNDLFEKNELETESLVFPPWPPADENTAGGVLKTRAKRSSRHPEFFAIGRGKSIHLVWPATAMSPRYGISDGAHRVDVEKFYQERCLQVSTGKAGKDFVFSDDDSLIVSLDKTGRLRFWDIRELTDETNATAARVAPIIVDTPLLSLSTASPAEKSWPTSVLFVDKVRPYTKGGALRYVLVGLRQNHTLQLWDIALGKAVQELNFPHENETDGICSVCYHPNSGIIVVGHPTRNSLFFIHLSAPRYTLSSSVSQSVYLQRIAAKDPEIPKPESTACMSGIREISFAEKGQLRSVDLMPLQKAPDAPKTTDEKTPLFELYVVHSKGVTCLNINKQDLGWNAESKVLHPVDASKQGIISLKELKLGSVIEESVRSKSPIEEAPQPSKSSKKKAKKAQQAVERQEVGQPEAAGQTARTLAQLTANSTEPGDVVDPGTQATKENKKKKTSGLPADLPAAAKPPSRTTSPSKADEAFVDQTESTENYKDTNMSLPLPTQGMIADKPESISVGISGDWLDKELKKIERGVSAEFRKELTNLYSNIQNDRMVQDSSAVARQEAVLRLVSTTLTNNVEKSLVRILGGQMQHIVVPAITGVTVQAVQAQVGDAVAKTLHQMIPHELATQLPVAISSALSSPQMSRAISDSISHKIAKSTENQLAEIINKHIIPVFTNLAVSTAEKAAADVEARLSTEMRHFATDRQNDAKRLEKLNQAMQGMAETMRAMSDAQVTFQAQILRDRQQLSLMGGSSVTSTSRQVSTARMTPSPAPIARPTPLKPKSKEEIELEEITRLMNEGRYEEGSIKWLQSTQPVELFDNLFVRFTPEYLSSDVSPLVAFSVAVTVANSLTTNTERRLEWVFAAFDAVDLQDPEIADLSEHAPTLIGSLIQKLESLYMTIAERNQNDPVLRLIPGVAKKARDVRAALMGAGQRDSTGIEYSQSNDPRRA